MRLIVCGFFCLRRRLSTAVAGKTIDLDRTFGPTLRRHRKAAGYTQEVLAERAEVHRTQISLLERGLRNPGLDMIEKLAGALGVHPGSLFEGSIWVPAEDGREGHFEYGARKSSVANPESPG
jgi:transcriptional regulator with XRE-family HTH domain